MSPEEARKLLDGTTPGPWRVESYAVGVPEGWDESWLHLHMGHAVLSTGGPYVTISDEEYTNAVLAAAAPELAETIAGMQTLWLICRLNDGEYEYWDDSKGYWHLGAGMATKFASRDAAIWCAELNEIDDYHLATRLISKPEVVE